MVVWQFYHIRWNVLDDQSFWYIEQCSSFCVFEIVSSDLLQSAIKEFSYTKPVTLIIACGSAEGLGIADIFMHLL